MCSQLLVATSPTLSSIGLQTAAAEMTPLLGLSQDQQTQTNGCSVCSDVKIEIPGSTHTIVMPSLTAISSTIESFCMTSPQLPGLSMKPGLSASRMRTLGKQLKLRRTAS
jgi:hypothetical protein